MQNYNYYLNTELYHHGVPGQRWGVRRYQNKDGTLTEAGKRHLSDGGGTSNPTSTKTKKTLSTKQKIAIVGAAATVATAAIVYSNHKNEINAFVASKAKSFPSNMKNSIGKGIKAYDKAVVTAGKAAINAPSKIVNAAKNSEVLGRIASSGADYAKKFASNTIRKIGENAEDITSKAIIGASTVAMIKAIDKMVGEGKTEQYVNGQTINNKGAGNKNNNASQGNKKMDFKEKESSLLKSVQNQYPGHEVKVGLSKKGNKIARVYGANGEVVRIVNLTKEASR